MIAAAKGQHRIRQESAILNQHLNTFAEPSGILTPSAVRGALIFGTLPWLWPCVVGTLIPQTRLDVVLLQ